MPEFDKKKFESELDQVSEQAADTHLASMVKGSKSAIAGLLAAVGLSTLSKGEDADLEGEESEEGGEESEEGGEESEEGDDEPGFEDMKFAEPVIIDVPDADDNSIDVTQFVADMAKGSNVLMERSIQTEEMLSKLFKAVTGLSAENAALRDLVRGWARADIEAQAELHKSVISTHSMLLDMPAPSLSGQTMGRVLSRRREAEMKKGRENGEPGALQLLEGGARLTKAELNKGLKAGIIDHIDVSQWQRNGTFGLGDETDKAAIDKIRQLS